MSKTETTAGNGIMVTTDTVQYEPGKIVDTLERCSSPVRWLQTNNRLELQQLWEIQHIGTTGCIEEITEEWRAVPTEIAP